MRMSQTPRRTGQWVEKFREAFRGIGLAMSQESSFAVHLIVAGAVILAAFALHCDRVEWWILLGCIGAVFAAETFNASIETLFHALDEPTKQRMTGCLDRAAGAVLLVAMTAAILGAWILGRRLWLMLDPGGSPT
jgi:diacylglycerol kinase (ATP)